MEAKPQIDDTGRHFSHAGESDVSLEDGVVKSFSVMSVWTVNGKPRVSIAVSLAGVRVDIDATEEQAARLQANIEIALANLKAVRELRAGEKQGGAQ
ncbi:hypothetical protein ACFIQG_10260 [Comamonas odontotermitis]|uniref:hypothetical protein n=1 Tax=Comamonas odontotermitis TaxID=379895 RepID=UPI003672A40F